MNSHISQVQEQHMPMWSLPALFVCYTELDANPQHVQAYSSAAYQILQPHQPLALRNAFDSYSNLLLEGDR